MTDRKRLRILFTNSTLNARAGSEMFIHDLAVGLRARGHHPVAFSTVLGPVAAALRSAAIPVIDDLSALTERPDIIHGQHHLELATALLHFPETPAINVCHGWFPWEEKPLCFPAIQRFVAVSELTRERLITSGVPSHKTQMLPNFVDLKRFKRRRPRGRQVRTAAMFGNYFSPRHPHFAAIKTACKNLNCDTVDAFGIGSGRCISEPETVLPKYDLVFAVGRCALEALACGCAVIVVDDAGLGGLVTPGNVERFRESNFALAVTSGNPVTVERLMEEIHKIRPAQVEVVSERIRAEAGLSGTLEIWERIYADAIDAHHASPPSRDETMLAASRYLMHLNPSIKTWQAELAKLHAIEGTLAWRAAVALFKALKWVPSPASREAQRESVAGSAPAPRSETMRPRIEPSTRPIGIERRLPLRQ